MSVGPDRPEPSGDLTGLAVAYGGQRVPVDQVGLERVLDRDRLGLPLRLHRAVIAGVRELAESLGLRKIGDVTIQPDNTQTRGKIAKIGFMLQVEEVK